MTPAQLAERRAVRQFVAAVLAFSDDPGPPNLERYLEASRALEESRRARQTPPPARSRSEGASAVVPGGARQRWNAAATTGELP